MSPPAEATGAGANAAASWSEPVGGATDEIGRFGRIDFTHNPFAAFDRKVFIASAWEVRFRAEQVELVAELEAAA